MDLKSKFNSAETFKYTPREDLGFTQSPTEEKKEITWASHKVDVRNLHTLKDHLIYINSFWLNEIKFKSTVDLLTVLDEKQKIELRSLIELYKEFSVESFRVKSLNLSIAPTKENTISFILSFMVPINFNITQIEHPMLTKTIYKNGRVSFCSTLSYLGKEKEQENKGFLNA